MFWCEMISSYRVTNLIQFDLCFSFIGGGQPRLKFETITLISNSPYCLQHNSYGVNSENLVQDQ